MGAEKDVSLRPREPTASPGTETLRNNDLDWLSALGESVSFRLFLSDPLERDAMAHVSPPLAAMAHVQSKPEAELELLVQDNLPVAAVRAQSASSNYDGASIGGSGAAQSCTPCLSASRSSRSAAQMGGAEVYLAANKRRSKN